MQRKSHAVISTQNCVYDLAYVKHYTVQPCTINGVQLLLYLLSLMQIL